MSSTQLNLCALSAYSGVDAIKFGRMLNKEDQFFFNKGMTAIHDLTWHIHRDYTINDLWARADHLKTSKNISVVFVDFIQRLRDERYKGDRVREVENISQELANMSRELNIAVIALSQLSGLAEKLGKDEMPSMSFLKESQGIAENADCIMMLHNPDRLDNPYTIDGAYKIQNFKILVEQRYGITGSTIECDADLRTCSFSNKSGN
jgi:replicative DNA helicase